MNKKASICQGSADKVREFFFQKKLTVSSILKQAFLEKREANSIQKLCTPSKRSLAAFESSSKKAKSTSPKQNLASKKAPLIHLAETGDSTLKEEALHTSRSCYLERYRIANLDTLREAAQSHFKQSRHFTKWPFREFDLAERNLNSLKKYNSSQERKKYDICCLSTRKKDLAEEEIKEKKERWEEFIKLKEERHFHLGRITKYFIK